MGVHAKGPQARRGGDSAGVDRAAAAAQRCVVARVGVHAEPAPAEVFEVQAVAAAHAVARADVDENAEAWDVEVRGEPSVLAPLGVERRRLGVGQHRYSPSPLAQ